MRFNEFSDGVTYFKAVMTRKGNTENHAMFTLFDIMRLIRRGKSSIKKFPNNIINHCMWIRVINKDLLNFNKLIMKINIRQADIKGSKDKNTNKIELVISRT